MAIVWPCSLSVDEYVAAGRDLEVPRPDCAACSTPMGFWSGYTRALRVEGQDRRLWVRRARCGPCATTHALLPAFVAPGRLDSVETIGTVLEAVAEGPVGVRPAAERAGVPHTTARGWWRRFARRAEQLAVGFAALACDLGAGVIAVADDAPSRAIDAMTEAFGAACSLAGWQSIGRWCFVNAVSGGRFLATNTDSPFLVVGRRRFMPPVP